MSSASLDLALVVVYRRPDHLAAREAVERAGARLQPAGPAFSEHTKCMSCRNESLPAMTVTIMCSVGVPVDRAPASHPREATRAMWNGLHERSLLGRCSNPGFVPGKPLEIMSPWGSPQKTEKIIR